MQRQPIRTRTRTFLLRARGLLSSGADPQAGQEAVLQATRQLDRAVSKGVLHRNTAARYKSRLMQRLNRLSPPGAADQP